MRALLIVLCLAFFLAGGERTVAAAPPAGLEEKVRSVLPTAAEDRWLQIPWRADLAAARAEAQRAGKPLYLWVMDGNPLGCG